MSQRRIWISWGFQRRSGELSRQFSAYYYDFRDISSSRMMRYLTCIPKTIELIQRNRPETIFVQNPSLILSLLAAILKPVYRYKYVNDLHTPYIKLNPLLNYIFWNLQRFCVNRSDMTIVTNEGVRNYFPEADNIFILPDKIPSIGETETKSLDGSFNVLYVCSFAEDEPYEEVRKASEMIADDIHLYVTGRYEKARWNPEDMPQNLHLTGFLPDKDYLELLRSVEAVMVLTDQEDCLVCGAYESISVGKPMILSNREILKRYFFKGAIYVDSDSRPIAAGIGEVKARVESMKKEIDDLKTILERDWKEKFELISKNLLDNLLH